MKLLSFRVRLAILLDLVLVLAFVLIGRVSHGEDLGILGILTTLWPFLVGLVVGHLLARSWHRPFRIAPTGITVWIAAVAVGMLLRLASRQGIEVGFIIVATVVLALFLLGWRAIAVLATGRRRPKLHPVP